MKKVIDAFDYAGDICKAMKKGILLTTKAEGQVNTMTIGWGTMGIEWGRPMFVAYVRESRYTHEMLERSGEFTVNIPIGAVDSKILGVCGTKSGRDMDKIRELNLTLEEPMNISVPGIKELPLTLECKILYRMEQTLDTIPQDIIEKYYPNGDFHYAYYGQIVGAYIAE
jgi:flavin reductase (DIM6/NTAB) family NADH-FMN oxidoreductase RutF